MKEEKKLLTEIDGGIVYSLASVLPYLIMFVVVLALMLIDVNYASKPYYSFISYLIPQIASISAIAFISKRKRVNPIKICSVKKCNVIYIVLGITLILGLLFGVGYFNELFVGVLEKAGLNFKTPSLPIETTLQFILSLTIIGVFAPVLEEVVFRGILVNSLQGLKTYQTVIIGGILFALFHQNPAQLIYQAIVGCSLTYLALKSGSTLPSIIAHVLNNVFIIVTNVYFSGVEFYNTVTITLGVIFFVFSILGVYFVSRKYQKEVKSPFNFKSFYLGVIIGVAFNLILIVVTLFA